MTDADSELRSLQITLTKLQIEKLKEGFWHRLLEEIIPNSIQEILCGTFLIWIGILIHKFWIAKDKTKFKSEFQQAQLPERKISIV